MDNNIDQSPVTKHGDGTITGTNIQMLNKPVGNKFLDRYYAEKKTDTEQLLIGLPEFIFKDIALYFLFDNYPLATNIMSGKIEMFINLLNIKYIKNNKIFDLVQWCKAAIKARQEGIINGYAFLDYCDSNPTDKNLGYLDILKHVKEEMPIAEYLKGIDEKDTVKYLSESSFNYMMKRITSTMFLFENCEDFVADQTLQNFIREGNIDENIMEEYYKLKKKIEQNRQKYYRLNNAINTKSALETGFTANLSEEECRAENQRNLQMEKTGSNKFKLGHKWLNLVTGGGLESKQLMVYGAPSGNGKTTMMISSTIDMAMYNPDVKHEPGLEPCILYISAETGLRDIKGRYIKMLTGEDISWDDNDTGEKKYLSEEEIENLLVEASRILSRRTPTKIRFIQVPNNLYSKNEIMRDIELLKENEKMQVVAVVADYIKGFRPVESSLEQRIKIDNIISDLRALAIECDVAVITASQVKVELTNEITNNRSKYMTSVIPKNCPETVFSESKGVVECADFSIVFAQTSNKYERNEVTKAVKYTHLEALVIKTRAGQHNNARAFIPYVEGSQIAFQKDVELFDENGKPIWLTTGELEFIGDGNLLEDELKSAKGKGGLFKTAKKSTPIVSVESNMNREKDVMDDMPASGFFNPALAA